MLRWLFWALFGTASSLLVAPLTHSARAAGPVIPGFERLLQDNKHVPAVDGQVLAGELNCRSCHAGAKAPAPKPAPLLDEVASRAKASWIKAFIAEPHSMKPGTTMPALLDRNPQQREIQAEALTHYLVSLSPKPPQSSYASLGAKLLGERTFFRVGCAACHHHLAKPGNSLATTMPLGKLSQKYTLTSLTSFLRDPLHSRPGGRMPSLNLTAAEAQAIAAWLIDSPEYAQIKYSYYEGNFQKLPDFSTLTPQATGEAEKLDVSLRKRNDQFALRFESGLVVEKSGEYTFYVGSDDGSRILIDGKVVAEAPGVHPFQVKSGKVKLEAGGHSVVVEYFEAGGEERLRVEFEGPGIKRQLLAPSLSSGEAPPETPDLTFSVDPKKAAAGRELFGSIGCASCHQAKDAAKRVASSLKAPQWDQLRLEQGCLSPDGKGARYGLTTVQARALKAAARQERGDSATQIHQTMTAFNCYACHTRDGIGGVEQQRDEVFETTMKEMGDEGRLPPKLDEAGAKLTDFWIDKTLKEGAKDRPYMHTRMPRFGIENVGRLRPLLVDADKQPPMDHVAFSEPMKDVKEHGRRMVGIRGFSCTQCHPFGRFPSKGIQSIDFQVMTKRLRKDWFVRYVRNPQAYRPRTRMPTAWPPGKRSLLTNIFDGDSEKQIAAVWAYLEDGSRARIPEGMVTKSMELIPVNEAIIYRNFIEGAGPRAIGVGYPEQVHQAFDANNVRIALLWQGRFIDASRHWTGRGQGFQPPAGENVLKLPDLSPFARLENLDTPWPKQNAKEAGFRFSGYQLRGDELRPSFLYRWGETTFEDFLNTAPEDDSTIAQRELTVRGAGTQLFYLAASGAINQKGDWYEVDGRWMTRIHGAAAELRNANGRQELLVPIQATGEAKFRQDYKW